MSNQAAVPLSPLARLRQRLLADSGLTRKAYLNSLAEALDYGARVVIGFLLTPLLVAGLGSYGFGLWQILSRFMGYLAPASSRPTQALRWTIASQQHSTDYAAKRAQVGSAVVVWLLFLPLFLFIGGVLIWYTPVWFDTPDEYRWIVRWTVIVLVLDMLLLSIADLPRSVLSGENLGYKRMGLSAVLTCIGGGLVALSLQFGFGLIGVAVATTTTTLLTGLLFYLLTRRYVGWFGLIRPTFAAVQKFFSLSVWFLVWSLVTMVMRSCDVFILGLADSVEQVSVYTLTRYIPETLINFIAILVFGVTPGLGGIIGSGNFAKAVQVRSEVMVMSWWLLTVAGATILLWNQSFVALWVGDEYYAGTIETLLIIIVVIQYILIRNDSNIIDLTLDLKHKVLLGILSAALSIACALVLISELQLGIIGLCSGLIAGRILLSIAYPYLVSRHLGITLRQQLKASIRPAIVMTAVLASALQLNLFPEIKTSVATWPALIGAIAATLLIVAVLAFYGGIARPQRRQLLSRIARVLRKPKVA